MKREAGEALRRRSVFAADAGTVLVMWIGLCVLENSFVGLGYRTQFVGSWEMSHARYAVTPIAVACLLPLAGVAALVGRLVAARRSRVVGALAGVVGALVAVSVSSGRHFTNLALRAAFVMMTAAVAAALAAELVKRVPLTRPRLLAGAGLAVASTAWLADIYVLPRLYPAFHLGLLGIALGGTALVANAFHNTLSFRAPAFAALGLGLLCAAGTPRAAHVLVGDDNLRRVLVEHAPLLGRAVVVAAQIAPPAPLDDDTSEARSTAALVHPQASTGPRALDWSGHDIVVITIDALRADHVSSYGYARPTTPNIDRLAARGARFTHAYCPTPHTSYSVTSMMTGKYMRPLLALGAGDDSETWAGYLRRYGFRTAAFYPPAVFFIDEHRFRHLEETGLGFEYRKVEFAPPELRKEQIASYVSGAPHDKPLFLWLHLFEPHEPYVQHPEHHFGDSDIDAYDSEIATADAEVGAVVEMMEKRRPGAIVIVSADHGEEFGDHGGRYHGTTVYEEQVRVPLVVVAPGVATGVIEAPVQTIDLLPTTLAALDVPEPARVRGRDLGPLLAGRAPGEEGLAFAETDDYTLVARGSDRLVCLRKIASCTLFDVRSDPAEKSPIGDRPARVSELRILTAAIERENGKLETPGLPDALRRCLQGDRDAAEDAATLFDDVRVDIRREAARCAFALRAPLLAPQLERAIARDEDPDVKHWSALALLRLASLTDGGAGGSEASADPSAAATLLHDPSPRIRLAAALALAERGDARGEGELVARWDAAFAPGAREPGDLEEARDLLAAFARLRSAAATPSLVRSLDDVRLRPYVSDALGAMKDGRAAKPLLATFTNERYVDIRPREAHALRELGMRQELLAPLRRFAGVPDPMVEAVSVARDAGLLESTNGGWTVRGAPSSSHVDAEVTVVGSGPARLLVLPLTEDSTPSGTVDGKAAAFEKHNALWIVELPNAAATVHVELEDAAAFWVVRRADEIPPPPPRAWVPDVHEGGL